MKVNNLLEETIRIIDGRLKVRALNYERRLDMENSKHIIDNITIFFFKKALSLGTLVKG